MRPSLGRHAMAAGGGGDADGPGPPRVLELSPGTLASVRSGLRSAQAPRPAPRRPAPTPAPAAPVAPVALASVLQGARGAPAVRLRASLGGAARTKGKAKGKGKGGGAAVPPPPPPPPPGARSDQLGASTAGSRKQSTAGDDGAADMFAELLIRTQHRRAGTKSEPSVTASPAFPPSPAGDSQLGAAAHLETTSPEPASTAGQHRGPNTARLCAVGGNPCRRRGCCAEYMPEPDFENLGVPPNELLDEAALLEKRRQRRQAHQVFNPAHQPTCMLLRSAT